jgi:AcrR family transcriptional regulator
MIQGQNSYSQAMTRKERETAFRKDTILDAARGLFEKEGFSNTTMAQIAAKSEFGVGTLYQFFPSKQILFAEVIRQGLDDFMGSLKDLLSKKKTWHEKLKIYIDFHIGWIENNPGFHRLIYEIYFAPIPELTPHIFQHIKDVHTEAMQITREIFMEANRGGERFDPELKSIVLLGIIQAIAQSYFLGILEKSPSEFAAGIMEEFLGRLSQ